MLYINLGQFVMKGGRRRDTGNHRRELVEALFLVDGRGREEKGDGVLPI